MLSTAPSPVSGHHHHERSHDHQSSRHGEKVMRPRKLTLTAKLTFSKESFERTLTNRLLFAEFKEYALDSPSEVNIPGTVRKQIEEQIGMGEFDTDVFDKAIDEVVSLLYLNTFRGFVGVKEKEKEKMMVKMDRDRMADKMVMSPPEEDDDDGDDDMMDGNSGGGLRRSSVGVSSFGSGGTDLGSPSSPTAKSKRSASPFTFPSGFLHRNNNVSPTPTTTSSSHLRSISLDKINTNINMTDNQTLSRSGIFTRPFTPEHRTLSRRSEGSITTMSSSSNAQVISSPMGGMTTSNSRLFLPVTPSSPSFSSSISSSHTHLMSPVSSRDEPGQLVDGFKSLVVVGGGDSTNEGESHGTMTVEIARPVLPVKTLARSKRLTMRDTMAPMIPLTFSKESFERALTEEELFKEFKDYALKVDLCMENIMFWESIVELEALLTESDPYYGYYLTEPLTWALSRFLNNPICTHYPIIPVPLDLHPHFLYFHSVFLSNNAPSEVNILGTVRKAIEIKIQSGRFNSDVFDKAVDEVISLLYLNTFRGFVASKEKEFNAVLLRSVKDSGIGGGNANGQAGANGRSRTPTPGNSRPSSPSNQMLKSTTVVKQHQTSMKSASLNDLSRANSVVSRLNGGGNDNETTTTATTRIMETENTQNGTAVPPRRRRRSSVAITSFEILTARGTNHLAKDVMPNSAVPLSPSSISLLKSFSSAPVSPVQTSIKSSTRSSSPPPPPKIRDKPPAVPPIPVLPLGGFGAKSLLADFSSPTASTPKSQSGTPGTTSSSPSASIPTRSSSIRSILHNSQAKVGGSSPISRSITPPVNTTATSNSNNNNTTLELSLSPTLSFTSSITQLFSKQSSSTGGTIKNENIPLPYMTADPVSSVGLEDLIPFMSLDHPVKPKGESGSGSPGKPVPPPRGVAVNAKMSVGSFGRGRPTVLSEGSQGKGGKGGGGEGQVVEGGPKI
ncbi:hypothetical protein HDU76_003895 [Blyttiomyces sp. JEL0837]|nr:hypothetical protein HDU76_003895 [Blyttiomyces sp. JEL0837]